MLAQRLLAVLLTILAFGFVIAVFVAIFRALDRPALGWATGIGFCLLMVFGFLRQGRDHERGTRA